MRPIINSIKHYFHTPAAAITNGNVFTLDLVKALAKGAARAVATDVEEGCIIKAVYLEYWISGVTLDKTSTWIVVKRPGDLAAPTIGEMAGLGSYGNKKNILNSGQGIPPTNGNVMNIYKGWIKIPKGKQRFGLDDALSICVAAVGTNVNFCGLTTYKEYE